MVVGKLADDAGARHLPQPRRGDDARAARRVRGTRSASRSSTRATCYGVVRTVLRDLGHNAAGADRRFDLGAVVQRISLWKNEFIRPRRRWSSTTRRLRRGRRGGLRALRGAPARARRGRLRRPDRRRVAHVLEDDAAARAYWQAKFRYLMVDEFQDTNRAQFEMVRRLVERRARTCASSATTTRRSTAGAAPRSTNILGFDDVLLAPSDVKIDQARAELSLVLADPALRQRADHQQSHAPRQAAGPAAPRR